jgi:hypothetical protein
MKLDDCDALLYAFDGDSRQLSRLPRPFAANRARQFVIPRSLPAAGRRSDDPRFRLGQKESLFSYFFTAAAAGVLGAAIGAPVRSAFTAEVILSAFFTSCVTCQICVSVKASLKPGIPVKRIPPSTFQ